MYAAGLDAAAAAAALGRVVVPGRMQRVDAGQDFLAVVDYAHKPAAIAAVLAAVRGGHPRADHRGRRRRRRPGHREATDDGRARLRRGADLVIVTDDNPRSEDPAAIRAAVLAGARAVAPAEVREIGDRRAAIRAAVAAARAGDAVVIAGKGHEQGQDVGGVVHPFSDATSSRAPRRIADVGHGAG